MSESRPRMIVLLSGQFRGMLHSTLAKFAKKESPERALRGFSTCPSPTGLFGLSATVYAVQCSDVSEPLRVCQVSV